MQNTFYDFIKLYAKSFEQFIGMELRAYLSYKRHKLPLGFWRAKNGHEVDFLLGTRTAIEVKATRRVGRNDLNGLKSLKEEGVFEKFILVTQDPAGVLAGDMRAMLWKRFLAEL